MAALRLVSIRDEREYVARDLFVENQYIRFIYVSLLGASDSIDLDVNLSPMSKMSRIGLLFSESE